MTWNGADFMDRDGQLFGRTMGEFLAQMVRQRWPRDTAKHVEKAWGLDRTTAVNLTKGHCSERTLTKALRVEGWCLLDAIGVALTGLTHADWEEQRLTKIIEEAERASQTIRSLRSRREHLEARAAALDGARAGDAAGQHRSVGRGSR